jgi:WD40 repeat protein
MRGRYADAFRSAPQALCGLSESWGPALNVMPHGWRVTCIAFSPDGSRIVSAGWRGTVLIWNTSTGEQEGELDGHTAWVMSVAFSPDGSRIVSGSKDRTVRIWNSATGKQEALLEGHTDGVMSVAFSHKGDFIVSGSKDQSARVWNTMTYETRCLLSDHSGTMMSVAVCGNDKYVVSGSDKVVRIWDSATGKVTYELTDPLDKVTSVAVSSDSRYIAAASYTELWIWDVDGVLGREDLSTIGMKSAHLHHNSQQASPISRCLIRNQSFNPNHADMSVAFSSDGNQIVSGVGNKVANDGIVYIWCVKTGGLLHRLEGHSYWTTSVAFSSDCSRIASGSLDRTVRIWDANFNPVGRDDGQIPMIATLNGDIGLPRVTETKAIMTLSSEGEVRSCALSRDGCRVVFGTSKAICVWNHVTNVVECRWRDYSDPVISVAFSSDGSRVVSGSLDGGVHIWNCHTKSQIKMYKHSQWVTSVAFSRDGSRIVFGSSNLVQVWNPATGQIDREIETDLDDVWSGSFSHDDSYIIYGAFGTACIWDVTTNETNAATLLSGRLQLSDGTRVYSLSCGGFHIYDSIDQGKTSDTPYLLSITDDQDQIIGEQALHSCWIPRQYREFSCASISGSTVCLAYPSGRVIILDLKHTRDVQHNTSAV